MKFPEREIILKDGRKCVLRPTGPDLAAEMIEYMKVTAGETEWLLRYPDEVSFTLESEQEILGRILEDPGHAMMAATQLEIIVAVMLAFASCLALRFL